MQCFTITDTGRENLVEPGLTVTATDSVIDWGAAEEDPCLLKRVQPAVRVGDVGSATHVTVSPTQAKVMLRAKRLLKINTLLLMRADIEETSEAPVLDDERNTDTPWLLVHVALAAGAGGRLWFEDLLPEKVFDGIAVRTMPRAFPGPGIKVLAIGCGEQGEPQALLKMARGAGFRVHRNGELDGEPPVIEVRYRRELEAKPPQYKK